MSALVKSRHLQCKRACPLEPADIPVRCAPGEVAMLRRNATDKTPTQIAATVALGQFLKVCNMMPSILTERLALRRAFLLASRTTPVCALYPGTGMALYELGHTVDVCWLPKADIRHAIANVR